MLINYNVPSPFAVQLEPVEGCSLGCSFCGIQSIRDNGADADLAVHGKNSAPYRFATVEMIERVAAEAARLAWNPRWEFAMHGDPSIHKQLAGMVASIRGYHPKGYIMVTSNGSGFLKDAQSKIDLLFASGLNTLALDDYKHADGWVDKIIVQLDPDLSDWRLHHYPAELEGNPHQRHNKKKLVIITDISDNTTGTHTLTNQGGSAFAATKEPLAERCAKPFRELSVRWDGNVAVCCDDWPGVYKIGNVNEMALDDIWYHPRFEAARRRLYASDRAFGPCRGCDVRTKRKGLLHDKLGKGEMAAADDESNRYIREAMRGKVFTIKLAKGE
jgi:radical SAM protein with 4Fe4S-binding SPASM domain